MNTNDYLDRVLSGQNLADDSDELKELQDQRKKVEQILRAAFPNSGAVIRYGGSKAKGTLNKESYDLDVICYFLCDSNAAGSTLEDIHTNVANALRDDYYIEDKNSAVRLRDKKDSGHDLHIDVVPGRFVDDSKSDCFLHQRNGQKDRLKTNIDVHIQHVRDCGVVPAIRLLKLWKVRRALRIRQFVFELLVIKLLDGKKDEPLEHQLVYVWSELSATEDSLAVEDPANPTGNDLTSLLSPDIWRELSSAARSTLEVIEHSGWESVFGALSDDGDKTFKLKQAAASIVRPTKPWLPNE